MVKNNETPNVVRTCIFQPSGPLRSEILTHLVGIRKIDVCFRELHVEVSGMD